jgi:hypothetical protein
MCAAPACCPAPLQDCDDAIESYTRTRSAYTSNLAPPSSYRTAGQRIMDLTRGAGVALGCDCVCVCGGCACVRVCVCVGGGT